jgi:hypothetical protein
MLDFSENYCKTNKKIIIKQPKNKPSSKKQKMKNKQTKTNEKMERFTFFPPFFIIINHLHKAMGEGHTSPWHIQHNESITKTLTMQ